MKMKLIISLVVSVALVNVAASLESVVAARPHVEARSTNTTHQEVHDKQTVDKNQLSVKNKAVHAKETKSVSRHEETKHEHDAKKNEEHKEKSLTVDTQAVINNNLPDYFKNWMMCGNDCKHVKLTYDDILKLIEKENISGQEAAVLGAIVTYINGLSDPNSAKFTIAELQNTFNTNAGTIYSWYYKTAIANINNERALPEKDKLFGRYQEANGKWHSGISKSTLIIQNGLGDCFTLSSINGMLNYPDGPKKLEEMISTIPGHPDDYWVNFPGYAHPIYVHLTPTKLAMYSELADGGRWLAIMSDAVARARRENPESGIFNGGYQTFILHLLTDKSYRNEALSPFTTQQVQLLKSMNDTQLTALVYLLNANNNQQLANLLLGLGSLTESQLKSVLNEDQRKAFKELTPAQLAILQSLTPPQWNEVTTLIYSNSGNINQKLLDRSLKANRTNKEYSNQLNKWLNVDKPPQIVGIETNVHDLTVLAYDAKTGMLTIKNPWGISTWYNPVTGYSSNKLPKNGTTPPWYDMSKGIFTASLSQLVESGFVTITIPIERTQDETKKLADDANKAVQPGGQVSQTQAKITQVQSAIKTTKSEKKVVEMNIAVREANTAVLELSDAVGKSQGCHEIDVCQTTLANAQQALNAADKKLTTVIEEKDQ